MFSYALPSDVADAWRPLSDAEAAVASTLIEYASVLLRAAVPGVDFRVENGSLDPALPRLAVVQMVVRVLRNPEGLRSTSETAGPFTESKTWDMELAAGELAVTAADTALVDGVAAAPAVRTIPVRQGLG